MKINEFFDKGFYINLEYREDRKVSFLEHFKPYKLDTFFERYNGLYHGDKFYNFSHPHDACSTTHLELLKECYEKGYERVLILEDDAIFYDDGLTNIEKGLNDLSKVEDWDMIYLGCMILDPYLIKVTDNLIKQRKLLTAHAVGYSKKGIQKILNSLSNNLANDNKFTGAMDAYIGGEYINLEKYVVYPLSMVQNTLSKSDLSGLSKIGDTPIGNGAPIDDYIRGYNFKFYQDYKKTMHTLNRNYVTCALHARTGNMMFQIANAYTQSLIHNRQFIAPRFQSSSGHLEKTLFRKIDFFLNHTNDIPSPRMDVTGEFTFHTVPPPGRWEPTIYSGFYQSEKFFGNYKEQIRSLFSPTSEFKEKAYKEYPFLKDHIVAAINVRRGDYIGQCARHPVASLEYIKEAYKQLPPHEKLLIMSDDIEWCKQNIDLPNTVFNDNDKFWDGEGIWLLSMCDHFIISNSTFSWWGAWLSNYDRKVVIAPSTWFGPDMDSNIVSNDIYCDGWIKIPTKFQDGFIVPSYEI
jgi:GR25 family glycosyltransferase involved in LPS biosynthesis